MPDNNTQSRKWLLTINNPDDNGLPRDELIDRAQKFNPDYFCMADEIGASGTYHTHLYLYSQSPMRFGTVKRRFPTAHIDKANGTSKENRDYIRKDGKWADTAKAETRVEGTFYAYGELPQKQRNGLPRCTSCFRMCRMGSPHWKSLKAIQASPLREGILMPFGKPYGSKSTGKKTEMSKYIISTVTAAPVKPEAFTQNIPPQIFAESRTTAAEMVFVLMPIMVIPFWYLRNFTLKFPLHLC